MYTFLILKKKNYNNYLHTEHKNIYNYMKLDFILYGIILY